MQPLLRQPSQIVLPGLLALAALVAGACGGAAPSPTRLGTPGALPTPGPLATVIVASSDLGVGSQRFALALLGANQRPITNATVRLRFSKQAGQDKLEPKFEADAVFRGQGLDEQGLEDRGVYATRVTFDSAGIWNVRAVASRSGRGQETASAFFQVAPKSETPAIGDPAPASKNKTVADVKNIDELTSARPPDPALYKVSIADAIASHRPFLVVFATPAFCTSKTCGPQIQVVDGLRAKYGDRMNFIHIEIYNNPVDLMNGGSDRSVRPAVREWNLPTDPWVFLVDAKGRVFDKFEGFAPAAELEESINRMLSVP
jgi:hypothetical protein